MANKFTDLAHLDEAILEITDAYRKNVLAAVADGVEEGAEIFRKEAKEISPYDPDNHKTPHYKDSWVIKPMKKAKFVKYVGNTKRVPGKMTKKGTRNMIPLINILEYTKRVNKEGQPVARPVVQKAMNNSKDRIINLIISKIQKEGGNA